MSKCSNKSTYRKQGFIRRIISDKIFWQNYEGINTSERNIMEDYHNAKLKRSKDVKGSLAFISFFTIKDNPVKRWEFFQLVKEQTKIMNSGKKDLSQIQRKYWRDMEMLTRLKLMP